MASRSTVKGQWHTDATQRDCWRAGTHAEKKQFLRLWVDQMKLAPESLEVEVDYKIPEPVVNSVGAGGGFEPPAFGL